jgi:hypothetical protein
VDYQSNSNKDKDKKNVEKKVERVIHTEVLVQKKGVGQKFKDLFIETAPRSVMQFIFYEVILPAARSMIVDSASKGVERMMYGDRGVGRTRYGGMAGGTRYTYNNPVVRGFGNTGMRPTPAPPAARQVARSNPQDNLIFGTRAEAAAVIEAMENIIDQYEFASVVDLNRIVGLESSYTDNNWGWEYFGDAQVQQVREGFLLNIPPAQPAR